MAVEAEEEIIKFCISIDFCNLQESLNPLATEWLNKTVSKGGKDPQEIFNLFGSHIVTKVKVGQALTYYLTIDHPKFESEVEFKSAIKLGLRCGFLGVQGNMNSEEKNLQNKLRDCKIVDIKQKGHFRYKKKEELSKFNKEFPKVNDCVPI